MNKLFIGIAVILVIIGILGTMYWIGLDKERHHEYCTNWSNNIDSEKQDIGNQVFPDRLNQEISDYNKECAFH